VISGTERIVHQVNPWDALGHQAVEEFIVLFDQRAFSAAANVAGTAKIRVSHLARKRELVALEQLASAFDHWDRFDHEAARKKLDAVEKAANDLRAALGQDRADRLFHDLKCRANHLDALCCTQSPSPHHVVDLLANAKRRREEGRFDDAVARLYRAIEAIAQVTLKNRHEVESTERIPLERIPEPLRSDWRHRAEDGFVTVGLQDAYRLLLALGDELGRKFEDAKLNGRDSPLIVRNRSILAHGFEKVPSTVVDQLWKSALGLAQIDEAALPRFPTLGS
jgi:CRISPR-associated protein (TIGR02710 family)